MLVVDLDVHQGDGTHAAFMDDPETFTFSMNGFRNYPFRRVPGDLELDLATAPGTTPTWTGSRGCCRRRSLGPVPTCASTSAAPTRTNATGWAGWR